MLFFFGDFLLSSFTNITSYLLIISWLKKDVFTYLLEGIILSIIFANSFYLLVFFIIFLINRFIKLKVNNLPSFLCFFIYNYFIFNFLMWFITQGAVSNIIFNFFFNLLLIIPCYKLFNPRIKLIR